MSGISSISSTSALWSTTSKTTSTSSVQDTFSQMVENLQSGAPATGYGDNGSSSSDDDTVTMTKVLSDGSVLITVMQDGKIISQTKTRAAKPQDQPEVTNMTTVDKGTVAYTAGANTVSLASSQQSSLLQNLDKFNDTSTSITSGSLFTSAV